MWRDDDPVSRRHWREPLDQNVRIVAAEESFVQGIVKVRRRQRRTGARDRAVGLQLKQRAATIVADEETQQTGAAIDERSEYHMAIASCRRGLSKP
jgi:hypothetical protein